MSADFHTKKAGRSNPDDFERTLVERDRLSDDLPGSLYIGPARIRSIAPRRASHTPSDRPLRSARGRPSVDTKRVKEVAADIESLRKNRFSFRGKIPSCISPGEQR